MSQPKFDTKINCLEHLKDEIGVILEEDPTIFFYVFFSLTSYVYIKGDSNLNDKYVLSERAL